jgi:hypothetical protein
LKHYTIHGADGEIGRLHDVYFDDVSWKVLFLVADTRPWLIGRFVLIWPTALGAPDTASRVFPTALTKAAVENGPPLEAHKPVSRQHAVDVAKYWDWPFFPPGDPRFDLGEALNPPSVDPLPQSTTEDDPHLRAAGDTTGYHVHTPDGACGHIEDWLLSIDSWTICDAVIDTRNWWPGERVRIPSNAITSINWDEKSVHVSLSKEAIEHHPRYSVE